MTNYSWARDVELRVEFGFGSGPFTASPSFTDLAAYCMGLETFRGRQSVRAHFDAGTVTITLDNEDGRFDPFNSGSPYAGDMNIGTPVRIRAVYDSVTYSVWRGAVTRWPLSYPLDGHDALVQIEAVENLAILNRVLLTESYPSQDTDARIDAILTDAGWPVGFTDLDNGATLLAAADVDGTALEAILAASDADAGDVFIAGDGDLVFLNRLHFMAESSAATFDPAGGGMLYAEVGVAYDDDFLVNHAIITAGDGGIGEDSDATSIAAHGAGLPYQLTLDNLISAPYADNLAEWSVDKWKDIFPRVTSLVIHPELDMSGGADDLFDEVLQRNLRDLITVVVTPPGGGDELTQIVGVEGIAHSVTPDTWITTYTCHPVSAAELLTDYWILGVSDDLGTDTRLA